jgi:hypothetical protein
MAPDTPSTDIRIGYARCSTLTQGSSRSWTRSPRTASRGTRSFGEDQHPCAAAPAVRGHPRAGPRDQGTRAALPGDSGGVRDEAAGAGRDRTDGLGRPLDRARSGAGDARRAAARDLQPHRTRGASCSGSFAAMAGRPRGPGARAGAAGLSGSRRRRRGPGSHSEIAPEVLSFLSPARQGGCRTARRRPTASTSKRKPVFRRTSQPVTRRAGDGRPVEERHWRCSGTARGAAGCGGP